MKNILVLGLLMAVLMAGCLGPSPPQGKGRVVFTMADAAADMGAVSSVMVTVDSVSVHSASRGWVTVSSTPRTYDLLELKASGQQALLADAQLDEGDYQQMRLQISKVVVTDANGTHEAKLPSGELKVAGGFSVDSNSTSTATFDFVADESLHVTGNGQYILAPVVQVETREDAEATVESNSRVRISGGTVRTNARVGMDINGNVGVGVRIPANANLSIVGGAVVIGPGAASGQGRVIVGVSDAAANLSSVSKIMVTIDEVSVHSASKGWVTLSSTPLTVDLLELNASGDLALLANATIDEGTYQQVRLKISKVVVTDANGTHDAKLPSGELKVIGDLVVKANSTSAVTFDFLADQSLHLANNGTVYLMAPVVKVEMMDGAQVQGKAKNRFRVSGGKTGVSVTVGMDERGDVGAGKRISPNAAVTISANGTINILPPGIAGGNGTILDVGGSMGVN